MGLTSFLFGRLHVKELKKIVSSARFDPEVRKATREALLSLGPRVERVKEMNKGESEGYLTELVNGATADRKVALLSGGADERNPRWAAAAACESWLQCIALSPGRLPEVEALVNVLIEME